MATVLIVDDDKHTRALLERLLATDARFERHELRVVHAGDGVEGLRLFDAEKPDLVITDLLMPRMDGFKFCRELRARARQVALLVLSGVHRDANLSSRLRDELGALYFAKPFQIKELITAVDKELLRLGRPGTATNPPSTSEPPQPASLARGGAFAETPLARLLLDLHEARATGHLELRRGRIEKRIDLVVGHPIAVSSNQRAEMLGHFLVARGVLSEKAHQEALQLAHDEDKKVGEALLELGYLGSAELLKHLTAQARFKITRALRWPDGVWAFQPDRELLDATKGNALDPVAVVFLGLRKSATLEDAARAVQPLSGRQVALTPRGARLLSTIARVFGEPTAKALEQTPPFESFLRRPFEPAHSLPALEALLVTGCVAPAGAEAQAEAEALVFEDEPPSVQELSGPLRLPLPPEPEGAGARPAPLRAASSVELFAEETAGRGPPRDVPGGEIITFAGEPTTRSESPLGDSALVEVDGSGPLITITGGPEVDALREELVREYLRVQGADPYAVLGLRPSARSEEIETAYAGHAAAVALERFEKYDLGRDHAKLEEIHAAYRHARALLLSPEERAAHDRERVARERTGGRSMSAELAFRTGERRLLAGNVGAAVEHFRLAAGATPDVADYQAALGWALYQAGKGPAGPGASGAGEHLDQALAIDPDHAAAHEYLGRVLAASGQDGAAAPHLERALDAQPPRLGALEALEAIRARRGEAQLLERRYRALLHRVQATEPALALRLWLALARLYVDALKDRGAARTAFLCASRLAPGDPAILDALAELAEGSFDERADILRARWRLEPGHAGPGLALFRAASEANEHDAAFLASAALAARGQASGDAEAWHRRYRPRFLARAMRTLDEASFARIRHPDDDPELGAIFALLEPAGLLHTPTAAADLGVRPGDQVAEDALPEAFVRVRDYVAHLLGVPRIAVASRPDFGNEAHLGAFAEPLLLVGPETLACTDRMELAFRLGRALSYLWPGRALAGSRPARALKELLVAAVVLGNPAVALEPSPGLVSAVRAVAALPEGRRVELGARAAKLAAGRQSVNLSAWAQALARTADRVGLVLCGDLPRAVAACRQQSGEPAVAPLLDWATSADHRAARALLGLSIDV